MFAASVAGAVLVSVTSVLTFVSFGVLGHQTVRIWCDNEAAVMAANDASSIKRLAYIARRGWFSLCHATVSIPCLVGGGDTTVFMCE
jgi:hypothetical protein